MPSAARGLTHAVFFTLNDKSEAARDALIAACHKYLPNHEGVVYFSAGPRGEAYQRPVNDQQFDVALVVAFDCEAAHDRYQESPAHKEFIAKESANWAQVRVFDAVT